MSGDWALTKNFPGGQDLANFEDLPQDCRGGGEALMVGID